MKSLVSDPIAQIPQKSDDHSTRNIHRGFPHSNDNFSSNNPCRISINQIFVVQRSRFSFFKVTVVRPLFVCTSRCSILFLVLAPAGKGRNN